ATANGQERLAISAVATALRRAVAISPLAATNGQASADVDARPELVLWDTTGLAAGDVQELSRNMGVNLSPATSQALGLATADSLARGNGEVAVHDPPEVARFAPALALALSGARRTLPIDLANSRLASPPERKISRSAALPI